MPESEVQLSTPLPPARLAKLVVGHEDLEAFASSRTEAVNVIVRMLKELGVDPLNFRSILELGCGCGRILAGWENRLSPEAKLFGCDLNGDLVDFCKNNIGYAEVIKTGYYPPLPYDNNQFDFVYLASVYTHISLDAMIQWTGELARIVRPGGVVMVTTLGSYYWPELVTISKLGMALLAERGHYTHLHVPADATWKGSNDYATWVSPDFLRRMFIGFRALRAFPGLSCGPTPLVGWQDVMFFRREAI